MSEENVIDGYAMIRVPGGGSSTNMKQGSNKANVDSMAYTDRDNYPGGGLLNVRKPAAPIFDMQIDQQCE